MKRRNFLKKTSLLLSFSVAGQSLLLSPAQAQSQKLPLLTLKKSQAESLNVLADAIVPGARQAGLAHYLDHQLSQTDDAACLLLIRYLGVPQPFSPFYTAGVDAADRCAKTRFGQALNQLSEQQLEQFIGLMASDTLEDWQGPPSSFFYFVLRSDAVDVAYGTESAFEQNNIPYMAHIRPPSNW